MMKILVIVAHPDDEVLGMGGTIAKHVAKGDKVHIVYLTTGITSRRNSGYKSKSGYQVDKKNSAQMDKEIQKLKNNALKSCKTLGVKSSNFYDFPDNELDKISRLQIIKTIENEIEKFKPDQIFTNHYGDLNIDHRIVFESCLTACRPISDKTPSLFAFGVISSMEWNYPSSFEPNYFVNISKYFKKKIQAMKSYKNELKKYPHPRSLEGIRITAEKWGTVCGYPYVEPFEIIRIIDK